MDSEVGQIGQGGEIAPHGYFFALTPDRVLDAVEASGLRCTGRCVALNSFENRVYDVELEADESSHRIAKFYRPGRWSSEQILEEHEFLADLVESEIPAVAPLVFPNNQTLQSAKGSQIYYALFPRVGGRAPDELSDEQLRRIGRLLGRIHNVGASKKAKHRFRIEPETYAYVNLEFLLRGNWIPLEFQKRYQVAVEKIGNLSHEWYRFHDFHRIHGDCHLGNLLWNDSGPYFLDFDDMLIGPAVQDVWLLVPGRDNEAVRQRDVLLEGYSELREFDYGSLRLIESLRALRFIHYTSWIARRWDDPAFPKAFPQFGTHHYWSEIVEDMEMQVSLLTIRKSL